MQRTSLLRYAWLSIGAAVLTIGLKLTAYYLSGSVGLLSDALESIVNLVAAGVALAALIVAARPPDDDHNFGHDKAEYFSSGVEGTLILIAALGIAYTSILRLRNLQPLEDVGLGLVVSVIASLVNGGVAMTLLRASKEHHSITLEADAHHLLTDVWTSIGVIIGVAAVAVTGWLWLDPVIALLVAVNILWSGFHLVRRSTAGLMDEALDKNDLNKVTGILDRYKQRGLEWHGLRTRKAGIRAFVDVDILVQGEMTVQAGHDLLEAIEADIRGVIPRVTIKTHIEPLHDPKADADKELDRVQ